LTNLRQYLHERIDALDEAGLARVRAVVDEDAPPYWAALVNAPVDDEPMTEEDIEAVRAARLDVQEGRVVSHAEVLREFGLDPGPHLD